MRSSGVFRASLFDGIPVGCGKQQGAPANLRGEKEPGIDFRLAHHDLHRNYSDSFRNNTYIALHHAKAEPGI